MKIAFVLQDYDKLGGHGRYVAELVQIFSAKHEIHVFASTCKGIDLSNIVFHHIPSATRPVSLKVLIFFLKGSLKIPKDKFDIIHSQGICILWQDVITAHCCHVALRKELKWNIFLNDLLKRIHYCLSMIIFSYLEKIIFRKGKSRKIIAVSTKTKNEIIAYHKRNKTDVKVIYNGVNLEEFSKENKSTFATEIREKYKIPSGESILLFVGEFKIKGLKYVINALPYLNDLPIKLLIVGKGKTDFYHNLSKALCVENKVIFTGYCSDVKKYYKASDLFIYPTLYDSFPLVILEAMASGLPVITSNLSGAAEILKSYKNAIILDDPTNPEEIAARIRELLQNDLLKESLSKNARRTAEEYSWKKVAQETLNVYEEILKMKAIKK